MQKILVVCILILVVVTLEIAISKQNTSEISY